MGVHVDPEGFETRALHGLVDFEGKAVLEVGAGDGRMTWRFADRSAHVLAIDPFEKLVRRAIAETPSHLSGTVEFIAADATSYDYPSGAFDVAVLSYSL